jgi:signal transduction histidine kinase
METVHNFARDLRPAILDELGLVPALRSCLNNFARRTGLRVCFRGTRLAEALAGEKKTVLFRVAQESLTNVARHAQASRVQITLRKSGNTISMEVADDGRSFLPGEKNNGRHKGLGLLGMQERVRLVNGRFQVRPDPGKGTTVLVEVPFKATETSPRPVRGAGRASPAGNPIAARGITQTST